MSRRSCPWFTAQVRHEDPSTLRLAIAARSRPRDWRQSTSLAAASQVRFEKLVMPEARAQSSWLVSAALFLGICCRVDEMSHRRRTTNKAMHSLFRVTISAGRALVLTQVYCPGNNKEGFQVAVGILEVPKKSPSVCASLSSAGVTATLAHRDDECARTCALIGETLFPVQALHRIQP